MIDFDREIVLYNLPEISPTYVIGSRKDYICLGWKSISHIKKSDLDYWKIWRVREPNNSLSYFLRYKDAYLSSKLNEYNFGYWIRDNIEFDYIIQSEVIYEKEFAYRRQ
jgi:hypothetical protein